MKTLNQYIEQNRINKEVEISASWYGELYINTRAVFYDVPTATANKNIFAFISYPSAPKPSNGYPAVLLIHGGNGGAFYEMAKEWSDRGFVVIAPDFNGKYAHSVNERQIVNENGGNAGYGSISDLHDEHTWAYFSVLSAMRAIDVLLSLEEVDKSNIFSCGLSWGGFIQLLLSAVDSRIRAASVIYSSAFIMESEWGKKQLSQFTNEADVESWVKYIEPHNYLEQISHPVFFTAGADDIAFKMENRRKTTEAIKAPVYYGLRKSFPHGNFYGFEQKESSEFFMSFVVNYVVSQPKFSCCDNRITVEGEKNSELSLCYTVEDVDATDKQIWEEISISENKQIELPIDCTAFFVTEKTTNGLQFSSKMARVR